MANKEAGPEPLSVKVPMLETDAGVTESEAGLTDTAEPAAAEERRVIREKNVSENFNNACKKKSSVNRRLPSTDCVACIELKPFCKTNNEGELTGFYGNRPLIRS